MSEPKVIGALRRAAARIEYERERWTGATMREMGFARTVDSGTPADAALLDSLAEALAQKPRLVRCEACNGSGGGQVSETEAVGCEYCHATGKVIVLPASLLTTEED